MRTNSCSELLESACFQKSVLVLHSEGAFAEPCGRVQLLLSGPREPMTRLNLDAGRVWDQLLSSGGGCGSRLMRGGRQTLCVVFLLSVMVQPAARKPCSTDIITSVEYLIQTVSHQVGTLAFLTAVQVICSTPVLQLHPDQRIRQELRRPS